MKNHHSLFTSKSMKHMNPLENLDEYIKTVRPAFWLFIAVLLCAGLCVLAWIFLARADVSSFTG